MMKSKRRSRGFTLIELLVVVAIIGILAAVGMGGVYLRTREAARDGKRVSDMKMIQTGLEQARAINGAYDCNDMSDTDYFPAGAPEGPLGESYICDDAFDTDGLCVCAEMEGEGGNMADDGCAAAGTDYYCIVGAQ